MKFPLSSSRRHAFSLVELIVVIAIIVVIAAFTVPAVSTILRGSQLTQSSGMLVGQLSLARQQALTKNRAVEVRFYRFGDPEVPGEDVGKPGTGKFRAMQLFEVLENGNTVPLDKIQRLPNNVIFAYAEGTGEGLSSLLDSKSAGAVKKPGVNDKTAPRLPRGVDYNYEYVSFRFLQDGSTNLSATGNWYVTLIGLNDRLSAADKPPPNFFTVQVDPVSGTNRSFRPTAG